MPNESKAARTGRIGDDGEVARKQKPDRAKLGMHAGDDRPNGKEKARRERVRVVARRGGKGARGKGRQGAKR